MRQGNRPRNSHHGSLDRHCWFSDPFPDSFRYGALREDTVATLCIRRFDTDLRRNLDQVCPAHPTAKQDNGNELQAAAPQLPWIHRSLLDTLGEC
jgi:hypothetical protein